MKKQITISKEEQFKKAYNGKISDNTMSVYLNIIKKIENNTLKIEKKSRELQVKSVLNKAKEIGMVLNYTITKIAKIDHNTQYKREKQEMTSEEINTILNALPNTPKGDEVRLAAKISLNSGLRLSEVLALTSKNITRINDEGIKGIEIEVIAGKGDKNRYSFVGDDHANLFENFTGFSIDDAYLKLAMNRAAKKSGLKHISFHSFRHTFASHLVNNKKVNLCHVQKILGHSDIQTTMLYLHTNKKDLARAILGSNS